ncbi:DUF3088 domain-containing protein [Caulobacter sp. S45]|uniref:DUF3088 domain-containing protein n=1 Tax=Caulobacter sp. S45 TaxID=1641861 RepID=UPI001576321C|nr:DUF3088 domain-containing protein [Caulobacter sp. S45]
MKDTLFLLKPGFSNAGLGPLYCGDSVSVEGMLSFFPGLREKIDVRYIDFARPRQDLVSRLGEDNQSVPVLVLGDGVIVKDNGIVPQKAGDVRFLADERLIRRYFSAQYGLPQAG